jgi:hypothetical protein
VTYAPPIRDVRCSINGFDPFILFPKDGEYDDVEEEIVITLPDLRPGQTTIELTTRNTFGAISTLYKKEIFVISLLYYDFRIESRNDGIDISWSMRGETFGAKYELHRLTTGAGESSDKVIATDAQIKRVTRPGGQVKLEYFDTDVTPGANYSYYAVGTFEFQYEGQMTGFEIGSQEVGTTAPFPISGGLLSTPSPNPFSDNTRFSMNVPPTFRQVDPASNLASGRGRDYGISAAFQEPVKTAVKVEVFDVLGRRVTTVYSGELFANIITLSWDGRDENNAQVPSGVYFLKATAGEATDVKKILVIR